MSLQTRIIDAIGRLDDGYGVRVGVESLDGKCAYSHALDRDETKALCKALVAPETETFGHRDLKDRLAATTKERDGFRKVASDAVARGLAIQAEHDNLARTNAELSAAVAQMTEGVPVAYGIRFGDCVQLPNVNLGVVEFEAKRTGRDVVPLFAAVQPSPQAAELAAAADALQARVETLTAGERLTKDALAASEAHAANLGTLAAAAEKRALAAEARVKVLEGDAVPTAWVGLRKDGSVYSVSDEETLHANVPVYLHPPKTGEPVMWAVFQGDFVRTGFHDKSRTETVARDWSNSTVEPLYRHPPKPASEAPPPAAIGVEGERFVVLEIDRLRTVNTKGPDHLIGTRAQAEERAKALHGAAYRLVPIDAKTVDVATIRLRARELDASDLPHVAASLLAAIGEKGG